MTIWYIAIYGYNHMLYRHNVVVDRWPGMKNPFVFGHKFVTFVPFQSYMFCVKCLILLGGTVFFWFNGNMQKIGVAINPSTDDPPILATEPFWIYTGHVVTLWGAIAWWQMETFSALLAICAGNSPVPSEFPTQRPVTRNFDVYFDLRLNKRLCKQS